MTRMLGTGLAVLSLLLCAGCSGSRVVTVPEVVRVGVPVHLTEPTPEPDCSGSEVNADLLDCAQRRLEALRRANADKEAIRRAAGEEGP